MAKVGGAGAVIAESTSLEGASLDDFEVQVDATAYGCGGHAPPDDSGEKQDQEPADQTRDRVERDDVRQREELTEYHEWRRVALVVNATLAARVWGR